jgi:nucleotide-binding universal stress UspA family protein
MLDIKNVLVATDFSEWSDAALVYARALAGTFGARLHILHAVEFVATADVMGIAVPDLYKGVESSARQQLGGLISDTDREIFGATPVLVSGGTPAQAIVEYATKANIDLIVVGTHGRRGLSHMVLGSVAERVVRLAPCPVLTVRHPQREFVVARAKDQLVAARS